MTGTLKGAAQGALWGGITGGLAYGVAQTASALAHVSSEVGHGASFLNGGGQAALIKATLHGVSRAIIQKARYGTMKGAFLSGFISSGFSIGNEGYGNAMSRTAIMAVVGGTVSELGGGKFANGAMGSAFQYLLNDMTFKQSMKKLWNRKGEIWSDAGEALKGGLRGYRNVRDNAPSPIKIWLRGTLTVTEMGLTAGLSGLSAISYDVASGALLDTYQVTGSALLGFYSKTYVDLSLGTEPVSMKDLNPYQ